jgi:hypothetical protein
VKESFLLKRSLSKKNMYGPQDIALTGNADMQNILELNSSPRRSKEFPVRNAHRESAADLREK